MYVYICTSILTLLFTFTFFIKVIYCQPPFPPRNGFIIDNCTNTLGSVCSFGCKEGYILQNGATKRTCLLKAPGQILGYWNGSEPSCKSRCRISDIVFKYPATFLGASRKNPFMSHAKRIKNKSDRISVDKNLEPE